MKIVWVCRQTDMQESCSFEHVDINSIMGSNKSEASTITFESWNADFGTQNREDFGFFSGNMVSWKISNCVHAVFYKKLRIFCCLLGLLESRHFWWLFGLWNVPAMHRHQQNSSPKACQFPMKKHWEITGCIYQFRFSQAYARNFLRNACIPL